jgi:DNA-binding PadR family transcriptional regulator
MNGSQKQDGFAAGWPGNAVWEAMDQLRTTFEQRVGSMGGSRVGRGDVRSAVLSLLAEEPMHGYQIIHEIERRSGGSWKPSPGSVYPTLQLLTDEGLLTAEESGGRKVYALTDAGREEAAEHTERTSPWETPGKRDAASMSALPKAGIELAQAAAQVGRSGNKEQIAEAVTVLEDARRALYAILAKN